VLYTPPPATAALPVSVLFVIVSVPELSMPPLAAFPCWIVSPLIAAATPLCTVKTVTPPEVHCPLAFTVQPPSTASGTAGALIVTLAERVSVLPVNVIVPVTPENWIASPTL